MLEKKKTGEGLEKYFGLIKDDKESVKLTEELKKWFEDNKK